MQERLSLLCLVRCTKGQVAKCQIQHRLCNEARDLHLVSIAKVLAAFLQDGMACEHHHLVNDFGVGVDRVQWRATLVDVLVVERLRPIIARDLMREVFWYGTASMHNSEQACQRGCLVVAVEACGNGDAHCFLEVALAVQEGLQTPDVKD